MLSLCLHENSVNGIAAETMLLLFLVYAECSGNALSSDTDSEWKEPAGKHESNTYLAAIEDSYRKNRALMHDLKNHFIVLRALAEQKEYDKLLEYNDTLSEKVSENLFPVHSGNAVLDALLVVRENVAFGDLSKLDNDG